MQVFITFMLSLEDTIFTRFSTMCVAVVSGGLNTLLSHYFLGFYEEQHSSELANRDYYEQILTYLKRSGSEQTVYMNCDILCNIDLAQVIHLHEVSDGNITVVYKKNA